MNPDVAALVTASRAAQGLPERIQDPAVLLEAAGRVLAGDGRKATDEAT